MDKYLKLKEILTEKVEDNLSDLIALNDDLADHPELSGEEHRSSKKLQKYLKKRASEWRCLLQVLIPPSEEYMEMTITNTKLLLWQNTTLFRVSDMHAGTV